MLRAYPPRFRDEACPELLASFRDSWADARTEPVPALIWFWLTLAIDLVISAAAEWGAVFRAPRRTPGSGGHMESLWQDLRYALRALRRAPGSSFVAGVTIAIGIAATTSILSVANALLVRDLPGVREAGSLVTLHRRGRDATTLLSFSYPDFKDLRAARSGLVDLAAYGVFPASLTTGSEPELQLGMAVTGTFFAVLGTRPALGRFFVAEEDRPPGGPRVVVLSHSTWLRRFSGDSSIVGRAITLNGEPTTVIGVAEPGFRGQVAAFDAGLWVPLGFARDSRRADFFTERRTTWLELIGRMRPGTKSGQVEAALSGLYARLGREVGDPDDRAVDVRSYSPVPAQVFLPVVGFVGLLFVLAALILMIASMNVAGVLLARAAGRAREIAVRLAIGAGRGRLIRQLVTESVVLFLAGGALGTFLAVLATSTIRTVALPIPIPVVLDFHPDWRVFAAALAVTLLAGVGFGLAPALQAARPDLVNALKGDVGSGRLGRLRLRSGLVTAQVAGSVLLLVMAGLFERALGRAGRTDLGFDPANVQAVSLELEVHNYTDVQRRAFIESLVRESATIPGVSEAGAIDLLPLTLGNQGTGIALPDREPVNEVGRFYTDFATVSPGYFRALAIPILKGRGFTEADREGAPPVAVINETLANRLWPGQDPLGRIVRYEEAAGTPRSINFTDGPLTTIVGVVRNAKYRSLGEEPVRMIYVPMAQQQSRDAISLVVRTPRADPSVAKALREVVHRLDPNLPVAQNAPLKEVIGIALLPSRIAAALAGVFGAVGVVLVTVGLYGVLSYAVSRRRREIGIRMALGAEAGSVRGLVLREGLVLTAVGLVVGAGMAAVASQLLRSLLYGLSPLDPVTFLGVGLLMIAVALAACYFPARRATRTEPLEVLRHD